MVQPIRALNAAPLSVLLISFFIIGLANISVRADIVYEKPILVADPKVHTAVIRSVAIDKAGRFAVSGSEDKTVRIWSLDDGRLLKTIRMPRGEGFIGQIFAVAVSPDGNLIAIGGWTKDEGEEESIHFFNQKTGVMRELNADLPDVVTKLAFSSDGRYLAAGIRSGELRVYDRERDWSETLREPYSENGEQAPIYGITFAKDGRLATASFDHKIRLYSSDLKLVGPPKVVSSGDLPFQIAFSPDGTVLALGYADAPAIDLLDARNLELLKGPNTEGLHYGLAHVAWSPDGQTLYGGGKTEIFAWGKAGRGHRMRFDISSDLIEDLVVSPDGSIVLATADPLLKCIDKDGRTRWSHSIALANSGALRVSHDGATIDFAYQGEDTSRLRFDVRGLKLSQNPAPDHETFPPKQDGLLIESWKSGAFPTVGDKLIELEEDERSRALAIALDASGFVLGTSWSLRAFDADNKSLWTKSLGAVRHVNITRDARLLVAAYDDGTIRWHRMSDGGEILALMVLPGLEWVAWTPEGFYDATQGAMGVLHWQTNHKGTAGTTVPVTGDAQKRRRDILVSILDQPAGDDVSAKAIDARYPLKSGVKFKE